MLLSLSPVVAQDLVDLSLEDLMQVEVRLVSRKPDALLHSPAAIYVLTGDDLRRSGVFTVPDALRLVPGVHVAQFDASKWAITARGFNDIFANKLLVLFDGRSVYNPLFSGVFWEAQDILLEDIERIEVVRGPGGSVWGANAVNGVINVVRRPARAVDGTQVTVTTGGGGPRAHGAIRSTRAIGERASMRLFASSMQTDALTAPGTDAQTDDWHVHRAGLRADWQAETSTLMVEAQVYGGDVGQSFDYLSDIDEMTTGPTRTPISGGHLLSRWTRPGAADDELAIQVYYDLLDRQDEAFGGRIHTLDLDIQQRRVIGPHDLMLGAGLRRQRDRFDSTAAFALEPASRTLWLGSLFAQDDISLFEDHIHLTMGARLEHNDFTGLEVQPHARVRWTPSSTQTWWASVSRAVRTPSRVDDDERLLGDVLSPGEIFDGAPSTVVMLVGSDDFRAETLLAIDAGVRQQLGAEVYLDLALFHNWYDDIRTSEPQFPVPHPDLTEYLLVEVLSSNLLKARSWGAELAADIRPLPHWRLRGGLSYCHLDMTLAARSLNTGLDLAYEGGHPETLAFLRSSADLNDNWQLDLTTRYADELWGNDVDAHLDVDLQMTYHLDEETDICLQARNLLTDTKRFEYAPRAYSVLGTKVGRSALLSVRRRW